MSLRNELTTDELTFATVCFERIDPNLLNPGPRQLFESLAHYFSYHGTLSPKQLASLKKLKYVSDMAKHSDEIARGRIRFDDDARTDAKLNTVFNPVGRKH